MKKWSIIWSLAAAAWTFSGLSGMAGDSLPKLVDLGATQCIPCKKMAPILEELKSEYAGSLEVTFIDVWQKENVEQAKAYGIESIPTQIFISAEGKELWRHVGYISKADILKKWAELGVTLVRASPEAAPEEASPAETVTAAVEAP